MISRRKPLNMHNPRLPGMRRWLCVLMHLALCLWTAEAADKPPTGKAETVQSLLAKLKSEQPDERKQAHQALIALPKDRTPDLRRALRLERDVRIAGLLAAILSERGHRFLNINELPVELQQAIHKACGALAASPTPADAELAIDTILNWGDAAAPWLLPVARVPAKNAPMRQTRLRAAQALVRMQREEGIPALIESLAEPLSYAPARAALLSPDDAKQQKLNAAGLVKFGLTTPLDEARRRSVELLGYLGPDVIGEKLPALLAKAAADRVDQVGLAGEIALANIARPAHFQLHLKRLKDGTTRDRYDYHAAGVALAVAARPEHLPLIRELARSRQAPDRETAAMVLGLMTFDDQSGQENAITVLAGLFEDASSRVQKRAVEAWGVQAARKNQAAARAASGVLKLLRTGRPEVRYAAALALAEQSLHGEQLDAAVEAACLKTLNAKKLADAKGACHEALLSVTEPVSAHLSDSPVPPKLPEEEIVEAPKDEPGEGDAGGGEDKPAGETPTDPPADPPAETPQDDDGGDDIGGENTDKPDGPDAGSGKPTPQKPVPLDGVTGVGVHARPRRSGIPAGMPGFVRFVLTSIDNPARSGQPVFAGYIRGN